jgi:hypothetical protein
MPASAIARSSILVLYLSLISDPARLTAGKL